MVKGPRFPRISKEELLGAIREGVYDAMWQMITNATQMPCHDFFDSIKDGVEKAINDRESRVEDPAPAGRRQM